MDLQIIFFDFDFGFILAFFDFLCFFLSHFFALAYFKQKRNIQKKFIKSKNI